MKLIPLTPLLWTTLLTFNLPAESLKEAFVTLNTPIIIRPAQIEELKEAFDLDARVTFEFFKPLLLKSYSHLIDPKNIDDLLNSDLVTEEKLLSEAIKTPENKRLHIAYDTNKKCIAGLLLFHKEKELAELDLLLVDKDYRNRGIGKRLVYSVLDVFNDITTITVHPLKIDNNATLKFYESLGFKNLGSGPSDKINTFGVRYSDMYFMYKLDVHKHLRQSVELTHYN